MTVIGRPAALTFFRSIEAPIALEPIPASQENTILLTSSFDLTAWFSEAEAGAAFPLELAFISFIFVLAASKSSSTLDLLVFNRRDAIKKETSAATNTPLNMARNPPLGVKGK
ncbi:hypothetical protein D3C77_480140 [compost metagenome]